MGVGSPEEFIHRPDSPAALAEEEGCHHRRGKKRKRGTFPSDTSPSDIPRVLNTVG